LPSTRPDFPRLRLCQQAAPPVCSGRARIRPSRPVRRQASSASHWPGGGRSSDLEVLHAIRVSCTPRCERRAAPALPRRRQHPRRRPLARRQRLRAAFLSTKPSDARREASHPLYAAGSVDVTASRRVVLVELLALEADPVAFGILIGAECRRNHRHAAARADRRAVVQTYCTSSSSSSSASAGSRRFGRSSNVTAISSILFPSTSRTSKRIPS